MSIQTVSDWQSDIQRSRAMLLNNLLLITTVSGLLSLLVYPVVLTAEGRSTREIVGIMIPFFAGWLIAAIAWVWRGLPYGVRASILLLLVWALSVTVFYRGGLVGAGRSWMLLLPVAALILMGETAGMVGGVITILTYAGFSLAFSQKWLPAPDVAADLTALGPWLNEGIGFLFVTIVLVALLRLFNRDWLKALVRVSAANKELSDQARELEMTHTRLIRQTSQLQVTAEIARIGSSTLDLDALSKETVNHIQEGFGPLGVYFVGLFLLDEARRNAVLQAATGEAGRLLLEMGYTVRVDETTAVGWSIIHHQARVAQNLEEGSVRLAALPMPYSRSEVALPLRSRERILGAITMQSTREAAFTDESVAILQMMADLVATALDNARLFAQTQAALKEAHAAQKRYLAQSWHEFLATRPVPQVDYRQPGVEIGDGNLLRQTQQAAVAHRRTIAANSPPSEDGTPQAVLAVPLRLHGQVIGTTAIHETRHRRLWTAEEVALAETIVEQLALTIENLRLMDETRRRAAREQRLSAIADRLQRATSLKALLQTAAEELNQTLGSTRVYVRLGTAAELTGKEKME